MISCVIISPTTLHMPTTLALEPGLMQKDGLCVRMKEGVRRCLEPLRMGGLCDCKRGLCCWEEKKSKAGAAGEGQPQGGPAREAQPEASAGLLLCRSM